MNANEFIFSERAAEALRNIIGDLQQVSLLSAEKVRTKILHKLHLVQHQPMLASKKLELGIPGHFRTTTVLNYKIIYQVSENRIAVVDILMDKEAKQHAH